jgi:hypothetical protein
MRKWPPSGRATTVWKFSRRRLPAAELGLNDSLWLRWQLKNRGLLTLTQACQEHDLAVGEFQRAFPQ